MIVLFGMVRVLTVMADTTTENVATVELPIALADEIEQRLRYTDFDDVDAYVTFVMEEVLAAVEDEDDANYDAVDQEEVESRLESLGYLSE